MAGLTVGCSQGSPSSFTQEARSEGLAHARTDAELVKDVRAVCHSWEAQADDQVPGYTSYLQFGLPNVGVLFGVVGVDAREALAFVQLAMRWYCPSALGPTSPPSSSAGRHLSR